MNPSRAPTRVDTHDVRSAALMCLHAARLPARIDASGNLNALFDQDRLQWDQELVGEGLQLLTLSATGSALTAYHVEAASASVHATAPRTEDTDWGKFVALYDTLLTIRPSPIVTLNRAIAVAQHEGPERGLAALGTIDNRDRLSAYPFYAATPGELELRRGGHETASRTLPSCARAGAQLDGAPVPRPARERVRTRR